MMDATYIIRKPAISEKSTWASSEQNRYTFEVDRRATKPQIKAAVEGLFNVKVTGVNTLRQQGKVKSFKGIKGRRPEYKKAMVTLEEGSTIDVTTGV